MTFKKYREKILEDPRSKKLNFDADERIHYVYRVSKDGKHYYGSRTDEDEPTIGRGYYTSSTYLKEDFRINSNNYRVKVIRMFNNACDKMIFESYLHDYFDVKNHTNFINRANQTPFGFGFIMKPKTGVDSPNAKPVLQINKDTGEVLRKWPVRIEAKEKTGAANISECILDHTKLSAGFVWCDPINYDNIFKQKVINHNYGAEPLYQIDKNTKKIMKRWNSVAEVAIFFNCHSSTITNAISSDQLSHDCIWCYKKNFIDTQINIYKKNYGKPAGAEHSNSKSIYQFDLSTGKIIAIWDSAASAARNIKNGTQVGISNCAREISKSSGGYRWQYIDTFTIEEQKTIEIKLNTKDK